MVGEAQLRCAIALNPVPGTVLRMKWYFVENGQRVGPVERETLDERVLDGTVQADTLVWRVGLSDWRRATDVAELEVPPSLPSMPPPLPPAMPATDNAAAGELRVWAEARAAERNHPKTAPSDSFGGFWARLAAKLIDGILLVGIALLLAEAVATIFYEGSIPVPPDWRGFLRAQGLMTLLNAGAAIWFSLYFIRRFEATPGKLMLGLRVVGADGSRVGAGRIILRSFGEQLSALLFLSGYVMAAFDDEKRTLHDYLCGTRVVKGDRSQTTDGE
ncbi:MAG: hypothetical protein RIQ79_1372 [Verrucomicrobiota bacterium]